MGEKDEQKQREAPHYLAAGLDINTEMRILALKWSIALFARALTAQEFRGFPGLFVLSKVLTFF